MKKFNGNLMAYLNNNTKAAVLGNNTANSIQMIDVVDLVPNEGNFYGIRDIEQLAHSMALSHTVEPLMVVKREVDDKYDIISGERRYRAVSLRLERGEITDGKVPCIVHEPFTDDGKITAKMKEDIAIVCANSYREKTAVEKLQEVEKLRPIARIQYDDLVAENAHEGMNFRTYFAEKFLGISSSSLQRITSLNKLAGEVLAALQDGQISDTLAYELSRKTEAEQLEYLGKLRAGELTGTVRELQEQSRAEVVPEDDGQENEPVPKDMSQDSPQEPDLPEMQSEQPESVNELPTFPQNAEDEPDEAQVEVADEEADDSDASGSELSEAELERRGQTKLFEMPVPENITPDKAEEEAENWVQEGLKQMEMLAEKNARTARENGSSRLAAQWDVRLAAVRLVIETIK